MCYCVHPSRTFKTEVVCQIPYTNYEATLPECHMFAKHGPTLAEPGSATGMRPGAALRLEFFLWKAFSSCVLMHISPLLGDHFPLLLPLGAFCFVLFLPRGPHYCHQGAKMAGIECVMTNCRAALSRLSQARVTVALRATLALRGHCSFLNSWSQV